MQTPERIAGYRIEARIDQHGRAEVYKAVGPQGQPMALKLYPGGEAEPVRQRRLEALQAARGLDHPALCRVVEAGETDGRVFAVFEFVQGSSLHKVMRHRKVPVAASLTILRKAAEGLDHLVRQGRDLDGIAPTGILVHGDGRVVKILEPGMPLAVADDPGSTATVHGLAAVHYLAPERMAGRPESAGAAAVYSLGVIGYELLTGSPPVGRFKLPSAVHGDIPPEIDPVILRCMSRSPGDRYSSPGQLAKALAGLEARHGGGGLGGGLDWRWAALGGGVLLVVLAVWWLLG